jgi:hypothetical protein
MLARLPERAGQSRSDEGSYGHPWQTSVGKSAGARYRARYCDNSQCANLHERVMPGVLEPELRQFAMT